MRVSVKLIIPVDNFCIESSRDLKFELKTPNHEKQLLTLGERLV